MLVDVPYLRVYIMELCTEHAQLAGPVCKQKSIATSHFSYLHTSIETSVGIWEQAKCEFAQDL